MATATVTGTAPKAVGPDKRTQQILDEMRAKATPGFTSAMALAGQEGDVYLDLGPEKGMLVHVQTYGPAGILVTIVETVGIMSSPIGYVVDWDTPAFWPSMKYWLAFRQWKTTGSSSAPAPEPAKQPQVAK